MSEGPSYQMDFKSNEKMINYSHNIPATIVKFFTKLKLFIEFS